MWGEKYKDKKWSPEDKLLGGTEAPSEKAIFWAFTAYIFPLIPLISSHRNHHFVSYHIKQAVVFFVTLLLLSLLIFIPVKPFWKFIVLITIFTIWCFGITYALVGEKRPLPLIGRLAEKYFQGF
ncbi:MAG: Uncharacterized protein G01um1014107_128 [Parcubacteria group bacterium Gr01-1014_107]|nr:MAG: Uncharacterized protein G01um1014107_128 [Parcubacteria group bacterium Gr01-1014_107]